ncbi:plasmid pRiA4b ORF-3 family protein [Bacillus niameyensis]|uniref:plasmid pRiA4b ORF-3 family protein n=1 Tax=Bacillus niameyensis TaxID=1522308 RepID=UPI00078560AF|nr:plasmid pRiA4b ORF-3 family protein [Bacillus niameyensis]
MLIQCTKSFLDKFWLKGNEFAESEGAEEYPNSLMAWHGNFVSIGRKKAIVLMNNETRYPVVIYRPSKKDFSQIEDLISEAIATAFRMEGIHEDVIDAYLAKAGEISYSKTGSKSMVAKMNNTVREVQFSEQFLDDEERIQKHISIITGRMIQLSEGSKGFYPIEKLLTCLSEQFYQNNPVLDIDMYQLKIQVDIEGHEIWRRVLVPSTFSFRSLHHIIQIVFDWQNYHLHEFIIEREDSKPLQIVMDDDPETLAYLNFDEYEVRQERLVILKDVFPKHGEVTYEYDFGDSWVHKLILEKVVKSQHYQAVFIEGEGERPPEDVGGEGGFEYFTQIMANMEHPEYENMKMWAESQIGRVLSQEMINKRLKHVISGYFSYV